MNYCPTYAQKIISSSIAKFGTSAPLFAMQCYGLAFNQFKKMEDFKQYRRTQIAEMRPVTDYDIDVYNKHAGELIVMNGKRVVKVSISIEDLYNGSPKIGDMIARNPKNHNDQWLVAKQYFEDNFEPMQ